MTEEKIKPSIDIAVWHSNGNVYLKLRHSEYTSEVSFSISPKDALQLAIALAQHAKAIGDEREMAGKN